MTRIVAVHGVGNHLPGRSPDDVAAAKAAAWGASLASGLGIPDSGLMVSFAYYAPHLWQGRPIPQGGIDDRALDHVEKADPAAARFAGLWADALDLPPAIAQGRLTVPLRHIADAIARYFSLDGALTRRFLLRFLPEVEAYLAAPDAPARIAAREAVAACIATARPRIVVAHSLGTVVTYEALHAHPELSVDLLVTLGSPLALRNAVFERLVPAPVNASGARPPGVGRWVNVADPGDPVAILRPFPRWFPTVDRHEDDSIGLFDFHSASNYLASRAVADAVRPYLGRDGQVPVDDVVEVGHDDLFPDQ